MTPAKWHWFLILLLLPGCGWLGVSRRVGCDGPRALEVVEARNGRFHSLVVMGEMVVRSMTNEHRLRMVGAFLGPDYGLVKLFLPTGDPVVFVSSVPGKVTILDFTEGTFSRKDAGGGWVNLGGDLEIPLDQLSSTFYGGVRPIEFDGMSCLENMKDGHVRVVLWGTGVEELEQEIRLRSMEGPVEGFELREGGTPRFEVTYEGSMEMDGELLPEEILVELPVHLAALDIRLRKVMVNPKIGAEQFALEIPDLFIEK